MISIPAFPKLLEALHQVDVEVPRLKERFMFYPVIPRRDSKILLSEL